jgi:hypothetical protein
MLRTIYIKYRNTTALYQSALPQAQTLTYLSVPGLTQLSHTDAYLMGKLKLTEHLF